MTQSTISSELHQRRAESDDELLHEAISLVYADAMSSLKNPSGITDAQALGWVREDVWAYRCEIRDRRATRRELYAMARGELVP